MDTLILAARGTGFTFLMTVLGAAMVFFFRKQMNDGIQRVFFGFAAGVMTAACVWSLLLPAIEDAEKGGGIPWLPAAGGFCAGAVFLIFLDALLPQLYPGFGRYGEKGESTEDKKRASLLVLAVTLHNIPEGMAVGLSFAMAGTTGSDGALSGAVALAIGIGIQNFPEGAAVSLPLCQTGLRPGRAFLTGSLSGAVEPVFGILAVLAAKAAQPLMPWLLSFAAGAMMYVVAQELIPQVYRDVRVNPGMLGAIGGFLIMMILDVALG